MAWAMWGLTICVPLSTINIRIVTVNLLEGGENGTGGPCKTVVLAWETVRLCLAQTEEAHRSISVQPLLTVSGKQKFVAFPLECAWGKSPVSSQDGHWGEQTSGLVWFCTVRAHLLLLLSYIFGRSRAHHSTSVFKPTGWTARGKVVHICNSLPL